MKPDHSDREHPIEGPDQLRQRIAELEAAQADYKHVQRRLRDSAEAAKALLSMPFHAVALIDRRGIVLDVNDTMARQLGRRVEQLAGRCIWDLLPPELARTRKAYADHVFQSGQAVRVEDERQGIWYDNVLQPIFDERGEVVKMAILARDITERKQMETRLRRSEQTVRALLNAPTHGAYLIAPDGTIMALNEPGARMLGKTADELVGACVFDLFPSPVAEFRRARTLEVVRTGQPVRFQDQRRGRWLDSSVFPVFNEKGEVDRVAVFVRDITESKRAEEELERHRHHLEELVEERTVELRAEITERKRAEERGAHAYRLLLALSQAGQAVQQARSPQDIYRLIGEELRKLGLQVVVLNVGEDHHSLTVHYMASWPRVQKWCRRVFGIPLEDIRAPLASDGFFQPIIEGGESRFCADNAALCARGFPRPGRAVFDRLLAKLELSRSVYAPLVVGDQTRQLLSVFGNALTEADVPAVTAFANQAAIALENAHLLAELTFSGEQLRHLTQRIINAQEEEHRRLSLALHDEAGQALTALRISLELLREDLADDAQALCEHVNDAIVLTTQTLEHIRLLAQNLRPPALDAVGLDQALAGVCRDFARRTRIPVDYLGAEPPPLPEPVSISLYRLLQEALTNAARHARASRISVALDCDTDAISLSVHDDGQGFDEQAVLSVSERRPPGIGLLGIRERLEMLGGRLEITSQPGQGTRLVGRIPLQDAAPENGERDD